MFAYTKIMQALGSVAAVATDAYFNLVTLLLPGNGTNGAQNNTFLDESSNAFSITRNGNTTQGTFSPFSQTGWGNYFDGTSHIDTSATTVNTFGTGAYTVEFWVYPLSFTAGVVPYLWGCPAVGGPPQFNMTSTGALNFGASGGSNLFTTTGTLTLNAWNHVALVRTSTATNGLTCYINGVSAGVGTDSTNWSTSSVFRIGSSSSGGSQWSTNGYISNFRVCKSAVYSGSFTPSTTALTTTSQGATNCVLLTCQSNRFLDNSSTASSMTLSGTPSVQPFSPFAPTAAYSAAVYGGSGYFDGSGDYLNFTGNSGTSIGSNDWTVEAWVYCTSFSQQYQQILRGQSSNMILLMLETSAKRVQCEIGGGSSAYSPATLQLNTWTHCAAVRSGSNVTVYLNGVGGTAVSMNPTTTTTEAFRVGTDIDLSRWLNGYVFGLRMVVGTAVYTANFTPPTAPPTAITNTQLLLNFTNAGITDATAKNVLETVGNAQISTTQSKWGGSSLYFDGTGDYIPAIDKPYFNPGIANFTLEAWVYPTAAPSTCMLFDKTPNASSYGSYELRIDSGVLKMYLRSSGGSVWDIASGVGTGSVSTNTWTHIALTRNGSTFTLWVNGVASGTATSSSALFTNATPLTIGANADGSSAYTGYMDDIRFTLGVARYAANFTPPTAAFPLQ